MAIPKNSWQLTASYDESSFHPPTEIVREINRSINARLAEGRLQRKVIKNNLEAGLIAENVFRKMLRETLPLRYGVARGKVINSKGKLTGHLDVIIYDAMNYPALFIDDNHNQILPIEGVYVVIEVKSNTTKTSLAEAFQELSSVRTIHPGAICSNNDHVDHRPPILKIFSFGDARSLDAVHRNYVELNQRYECSFSSSCYSDKSPGSADMTGEHYMVHSVSIAGKGEVYHMLNGETAIGRWGEYTAGMMINSLLSDMPEIELESHNPFAYLSWLNAGRKEVYNSYAGRTTTRQSAPIRP
jgi:hypothetical protein